jgi:Uma2 family endonuclease
MATPAKRRATYEDLLAIPDHFIAEIIDGELVTQPRPAASHALASTTLGGELVGPFHRGRGGPGGWITLDEPELHLHGDILVPDMAGWRRERMPQVPDAAAFELAPDWVCEVLSPGTAAIDRSSKRRTYAREGVRWLWLIEPETKTLETFALDGKDWKLLDTWHDDAVVRAVPFDAIELELAALWRA